MSTARFYTLMCDHVAPGVVPHVDGDSAAALPKPCDQSYECADETATGTRRHAVAAGWQVRVVERTDTRGLPYHRGPYKLVADLCPAHAQAPDAEIMPPSRGPWRSR